jgi:hypothetical protein
MNPNIRAAVAAMLAVGFSVTAPGLAGQVNGLVSFIAGTPAKAAEVNGNFAAVKVAVDDNHAQITALNARIAALEGALSNIKGLNDYLLLQTVGGKPTVRVTAANLQVVNGQGSTNTLNGTGNLIVGYDEPLIDRATEKVGSHNIVAGTGNRYINYGGAVFGLNNSISGGYATVLGGALNYSSGRGSSVAGGLQNSASGENAAVAGGHAGHADESETAGGCDWGVAWQKRSEGCCVSAAFHQRSTWENHPST